jgi:nicotinate phosphoribosyltransferase
VEEITKYCSGKIGISFGIGTNLTNDVGVRPMNIDEIHRSENTNNEWIPTVKLSDEHEKYTGDPKMIELAKEFLNIKD